LHFSLEATIFHQVACPYHLHPMFSHFHYMSPTPADLAQQALNSESTFRFPSFSASDAVTIGLSLRKRFRASSRHAKGKGLVISIQTITGHLLFGCTVGDLGHPSGVGDVSMDSWQVVEGMCNVVRRTGHSSYYVEMSMGAMGKTAKQMHLQGELRVNGGAFPVWLENAPCSPIGIIAVYSGSSQDDHLLVVNVVKDYLNKLARNSVIAPSETTIPAVPVRESTAWIAEPAAGSYERRSESPYDNHDHHDRHDPHDDEYHPE